MPDLLRVQRVRQVPPFGSLPPFATAVESGGRHLVDQYGDPFFIRGCSPWLLMTHGSESDMDQFFTTRRSQGFNTVIVTLVPPLDWEGNNGATFDGIHPFVGQDGTDVDITVPNETYWERVDAMFDLAVEHGLTVLAVPMDWWGWARIIDDDSIILNQGLAAWEGFGEFIGNRYGSRSNILWMHGHDYEAKFWTLGDDHIEAFETGLRNGGASHIATLHLLTRESGNHEDLRPLIDFSLVYIYDSCYEQTLLIWNTGLFPAIHQETQYENENNGGQLPDDAGADVIRRQMLWSMTSGSRGGTFYGNADEWRANPGWQTLSTTAIDHVELICDFWETLDWTTLIPDETSDLLTAGRGTEDLDAPLSNEWATVCKNAAGTLGVIYIPTSRTISIDETQIAGTVSASWFDPTDGSVQAAVGSNGDYTAPGTNAAGDSDWLFIIEGDG